jgi:hypothetical protein
MPIVCRDTVTYPTNGKLDRFTKSASDFDLPRRTERGGRRRDLKRLLAVLGCAMPLCAQYAGPAILSRGDAPSGMSSAQLSFRPFVELLGVYDTGLAGVAVNQAGDLGTVASSGVQLGFGISGSHEWKHTRIGLDYHGSIRHYARATNYDEVDQSMMLGIQHQFTRHIGFTLRNSVGMYSRDAGLIGLPQSVPFDPSQSYIPTTDFFDNRTIYGSTMADLIIQRSTRLSFALGGGGFTTRRRSTALYGVVGSTAHGDLQYRISRRTTIGANYVYSHFSFNHIFSSTDMNGVNATYAIQLTRRLEFSGYAGVMRVETKFVQTVPVDPAVAAIIGITQGTQVVYSIRNLPNVSARLARTFSRGVLYIDGGHTVTPGNGLFLTSSSTTIGAGYNYTGLRRWSFSAGANYNNNDSIGNVIGNYTGYTGTLSASRKLSHSMHAIVAVSGRNYGSSDFTKYNRTIYEASVGFGFAPGDVPVRIW